MHYYADYFAQLCIIMQGGGGKICGRRAGGSRSEKGEGPSADRKREPNPAGRAAHRPGRLMASGSIGFGQAPSGGGRNGSRRHHRRCGLAGLVATAELAAVGRKVIVLEQEPRVLLAGQAFCCFSAPAGPGVHRNRYGPFCFIVAEHLDKLVAHERACGRARHPRRRRTGSSDPRAIAKSTIRSAKRRTDRCRPRRAQVAR
jgi:hypothetical protein